MNGFRNRADAGRRLAERLLPYSASQPIVLALPRGGVPVANEVARALRAPLDVWGVRKLDVPWQPEFGIGAVAEGGFVYVNRLVLQEVGLSEPALAAWIDIKNEELEQRLRRLRGEHGAPHLSGRTVIVVDDGIASGATIRSALRSIRAQKPSTIVLAVPVAPPKALAELAPHVDQLICLLTPDSFGAVGYYYVDYAPVSDQEVDELLETNRRELRDMHRVPA